MVETHAGAGVYDLQGASAQRSGEAEAGIARLMAEENPPQALRSLRAAVEACNGGGPLRLYPGSPWLTAHALRPGQSYLGCELREDDHRLLRARVAPPPGVRVEALQADGYEAATRLLQEEGERRLLLIDPPYERADDYRRAAALLAARPRPERCPALIWTPLKDLETFDAFLGQLEAGGAGALQVAQVRLRPLHDPMRLNGCAVVLADAPDLQEEAEAVGGWIAAHLGEVGAGARFARLR